MSNKTWTMRDGDSILISEMEDSHLHNTILFIENRLPEYPKTNHWGKRLREDLVNLEEERVKRGLPIPLISIQSLEYRRQNHE